MRIQTKGKKMPVHWIQPTGFQSAATSAVQSYIVIYLCGKCRQNIVKSFILEDVIHVKKVRSSRALQKKCTNQTPWSPAEKSFGCAKDDSQLLVYFTVCKSFTMRTSKEKPDFSIDSKAVSANARPSRPFVLYVKAPNSCKQFVPRSLGV